MPAPGELLAQDPALIIGRDAGLARLRALVDPVPLSGQVLLVTGEAGMGKTVLLAGAAAQARSAGMRVLSVTGRESESKLAFAGLHQLLRPVLSSAAGLPGRQAQALTGALGLAADPVAPDPLLTGVAVLTLLSDLSERSPVLVVADDAHWLDRSSLEALAFVGSRLDAERVVLLVGARGQAPPSGFDRGFPELHLEPLSASDAGILLDRQPRPPRGRARAQVLAQAGGNPMALIELATVIADDPAASRRWSAEPLPLTDRLSAVITARFAALPEQAQAALLLAAVADGPDLLVAASHGAGPDARALTPAEQLGLVKVNTTGLQFSHPLVRSAIYHSAPFAQRAAAHRQLADALHDQPDRRAWHLAAAALQPDEQVASLLEATAAQAQHRGGAAAAALAMERAAELSPDRADQGRRLVAAASAAVPTGQADWVRDLAGRALAVTVDPELRLAARHDAAWALAWSGRRTAALSAIISVAEEASRDLPALAWDALASAATVAYQSGKPASRQAVGRVLGLLESQGSPSAGHGPRAEAGSHRLWIQASTDPAGSRNQLIPDLRKIADSPLEEPSLWGVASAAWILDETDLAVRWLQDAMHRLSAPGVQGTSAGGLTVLGWAYIDTGRWDEALDVAAEAAGMAEANHMDIVAASADVITATVLALRADSAEARRHAARALATVDPAECGLIAARARRALGVAALAEGSYLPAFTQLRGLFSDDGTPLHNYASYLGVADLADAAVRAGRRAEGGDVIEHALSHLNGMASPRLEQLIARARGILADPASTEAWSDKGLSDPAGDRWPFERAQLRLDHAEWLRRRRRINDAKPVLTQALGTFRRLRAQSWAQRAEAELRACGVAAAGVPAERDALGELTPQQRQIVRLASDGLTNRQIGDRLFLSPRTVSSHLYRSYPKLGVAGRSQLRDVIALAGTPAPATRNAGSETPSLSCLLHETSTRACKRGAHAGRPATAGRYRPADRAAGIRKVQSRCGYPAAVSLRRMAVRPDREGTTEMNTRPNIVLVHGAWADGSSWSGVIERLQADGYHVTAPQFPLTALADDVARLRQVLDLQDGPTIVAGHSYGGQVMTALGPDAPNVAGLVYVAAFGLDQGESLGALLSQGPVTPALAHLVTDAQGFGWLSEDDFVSHFAADVDPVKAKVMYAVQQALATSAFGDVMGIPAWKTLPSWYLVAADDQAISPDAERMFARRMGATTVEIPSSHLPMVSHPGDVAQLIKTAAEALPVAS